MEACDETLFIARFNQGDESTFKIIFSRFYKPLCKYIYELTNDAIATDDIVQDLFLALWIKRTDFQSTNKIASFLFVSARNASFNLLTHEEMKRHKIEDLKTEWKAEETVEEILLLHEFDNKIKTWLNSLPPECRRIISLTIEGKKNNEIAEELQLSVQTVKNQKTKGLKILRNLYRQEYPTLLLFLKLFQHYY